MTTQTDTTHAHRDPRWVEPAVTLDDAYAALERMREDRDEAIRQRDEARADLLSTEHDLARLITAWRRGDLRYALIAEIEANGAPGWLARALSPETAEPVRRERRSAAKLTGITPDQLGAVGAAIREIRRSYERYGTAPFNAAQAKIVKDLAAAGWPLATEVE